jgi:hypothetical protein
LAITARHIRDTAMLVRIFVTFVTGFVAGIAPFVFMQLLPALLSPASQPLLSQYWVFIVVGVMVGAITTIIYAPELDYTKLHDVFFTAIGIPAVLIGTVSNAATNFNAQTSIATASMVVAGPPPVGEKVDKSDVNPQPLPAPSPTPQGFYLHFSNSAWAAESRASPEFRVAQTNFLVVIGEYSSKREADDAFQRYSNTRLQAERYVPKNLRIYEINKRYVLSYGRYTSQEQADMVYRLLRINDPNLPVNLIQY